LEGIETVAGELTTIMSSSSLEYVTLSPVTAPDSSLARIFWDRNGMALLLQVFHLPALTPGRQYQLWAVQGDQRIHAGAFLTAGQGVQYFRFDSLTIGNPHGVTTMVITAEPPGNTGAPTGAILLAGSAGVAP
jgi:anti-sigma-K factor RskA